MMPLATESHEALAVSCSSQGKIPPSHWVSLTCPYHYLDAVMLLLLLQIAWDCATIFRLLVPHLPL